MPFAHAMPAPPAFIDVTTLQVPWQVPAHVPVNPPYDWHVPVQALPQFPLTAVAHVPVQLPEQVPEKG